MKRTFLLSFILFISANLLFAQTDFTNGFNEGYKKGYCHDQGIGCIEPIPPISALPKIGESSDSYTDGYNRGFQMGLDAQKSSTTSDNRKRYQTSKSTFIEDKMYNPYSNVNMNNVVALARALRESKGRAMVHLKNKDYQAAADISFAGLRISNNDDEFMMILGQAYRLSGDNKNGLKWLKKASKRRPRDKNLKKLVKKMENGEI